jgi:hypothetical protein
MHWPRPHVACYAAVLLRGSGGKDHCHEFYDVFPFPCSYVIPSIYVAPGYVGIPIAIVTSGADAQRGKEP